MLTVPIQQKPRAPHRHPGQIIRACAGAGQLGPQSSSLIIRPGTPGKQQAPGLHARRRMSGALRSVPHGIVRHIANLLFSTVRHASGLRCCDMSQAAIETSLLQQCICSFAAATSLPSPSSPSAKESGGASGAATHLGGHTKNAWPDARTTPNMKIRARLGNNKHQVCMQDVVCWGPCGPFLVGF